MKSSTSIVVGAVFALGLSGCGPSVNGKGLFAPARALNQPEEELLRNLEALPQNQRKDFVNKNARQIIGFAKASSIFGQRLNTDLGIGSGKRS